MSYYSWLRSRTSCRAPRNGALQRPTAPRFRPRLEVLEDRTLPSTYFAATTSDLIADINAANKAGGANAIYLTAAPTGSSYVLTAVNNTTDGANGLPVISKKDNLTIIGNEVIERSTAAGTPAFRLFDIASGGSLMLENVTLQNGLAFGSGTAANGGAIYNQGTLTLSGATVQNNIAQGSNGADGPIGSHVKSINGQAGADAAGGGIWSSGTVNLQGGSIVQNNQTLGGHGGAAGELERSLSNGGPVLGNGGAGGGGFGGGLYEAGGSVNATNATVASNTARGGGGGSWNMSFGFWANVAGVGGNGSGGGLYIAGGTLSLSSDTVQANLALGGTGGGGLAYVNAVGGSGSGGGIYVADGTVTLAAVELLSNTAEGGEGGGALATGEGSYGAQGGNGYGGGLYVAQGTVTLTNDTMTGNGALGGSSGADPFPTNGGSYGSASGYAIFIVSGATVYIDSFTLASAGSNDIDGIYTLLS